MDRNRLGTSCDALLALIYNISYREELMNYVTFYIQLNIELIQHGKTENGSISMLAAWILLFFTGNFIFLGLMENNF